MLNKKIVWTSVH